MSDDPTIAYLTSRRAYDAALKTIKAHVYLVKGTAEQLGRSPAAFIETTLEKGSTGGGLHAAWDMTRWPSADDLRRDAMSLKAAFETCGIHWKSLPEEGRGGCVPPPKSLGAD